jgi:hypothetical protein
MPEKETVERAREDAREGKSPSTQAGEFVREEIHHVREGKHGVRSPKQAIAIGLSKARRAGVKLGPPKGSLRFGRKRHKMQVRGKNERAGPRPSAHLPYRARFGASLSAEQVMRRFPGKPKHRRSSAESRIADRLRSKRHERAGQHRSSPLGRK